MHITTTNQSYTYDIFMNDYRRILKEYSFLKHGFIGKSVLGKDIPFLQFGTGKRILLLCGGHHGKEWITSTLCMRMTEALCEGLASGKRYGEISFSDFFNTFSVYTVPMLNPDGINLCILGLTEDLPAFYRSRLIGMNGGSRDFIGKWQANIRGVDLNHNYNAAFEKGCSLAFADGIYGPGPTRYSGDSPESEPESRALADFTRFLRPHLVIAYHAQGEEIFYRFGGSCPLASVVIAKHLCEKTGYTLSESDGISDCSGYKDWIIDYFQIPAFTIEVGKGENPLPLTQFDNIFQKNFNALLAL